MKKIVSSAFVISIMCSSLAATALETVVFDAPKLLQESKEGKIFAENVNKKVASFQEFAKSSYEKIAAMQKDLDSKASVLSKEAVQEKIEAIGQKKKDLDRTLNDKKDEIEKNIEKEKSKLGQKFMGIAKTLFDKEGWGLLLEKNMPGVVCVADGKDITSKLIIAVNEEFDNNKQKTATKSSTKKVVKA
ncbi:MAG: Outer membrane chaperone Skp (OmpH) [candidate division TM6 bacterium GW2011_GWF2_37_49]|nr:MAG: Outer membrane chaperone Skp (OmpH) [candidate division TM6 bacterium GW2011_GWF2_37_49]